MILEEYIQESSQPLAISDGTSRAAEPFESAGSTVTAGIGVLVQRLGGMITVVDLVKGGPADLAKDLKIGQVVLEVDGLSVDQTSFRNVFAPLGLSHLIPSSSL
jgi:C-terminal processing protease CtpA/Prc